MAKTVEYDIPQPIEAVVPRTGEFVLREKGYTISPPNWNADGSSVRILVTHGASFGSWGETHNFTLYRHIANPQHTHVVVVVSLSFGYGAQWKIPSDFLKRWALVMGIPAQDFGTKPFCITYGIICCICCVPLVMLAFVS